MDDTTQNIDPLDRFKLDKAYLENKKIELEINQLKQSYFKKSILPILIQVLITSIIAIGSIYFAYKNILTDAKEKNISAIEKSIDVKSKSNQTILETIELTQKRNALNDEVRNFEITKSRLLIDSSLISARLDSMSNKLNAMQNEKTFLNANIVSLTNNKKQLINELGFATINHNLQELKKYPGPNYVLTQDLIHILQSENPHKKRTIDSLIKYIQDRDIKYISLFILYRGTSNTYYRDRLFSELPAVLNLLKKENTCLNGEFKNLLTSSTWTVSEKGQLLKYLLINYKDNMSYCGKLDILYTISEYGFDTAFSFSRVNYDLYWDYLKINRDLFTSSDTLLYEEDKYSLLYNIMTYSPQLYFSLVVKYIAQSEKTDYETSSANYAIIKSFTSMLSMPYHRERYLSTFSIANSLNTATIDTKKFYQKFYTTNKTKIDRWLYGNFETFRMDKLTAFKCMEDKTF